MLHPNVIRASVLFTIGFSCSLMIDQMQHERGITKYPPTKFKFLATATWVPLTCGAAAILVGFIYPMLDLFFARRILRRRFLRNYRKTSPKTAEHLADKAAAATAANAAKAATSTSASASEDYDYPSHQGETLLKNKSNNDTSDAQVVYMGVESGYNSNTNSNSTETTGKERGNPNSKYTGVTTSSSLASSTLSNIKNSTTFDEDYYEDDEGDEGEDGEDNMYKQNNTATTTTTTYNNNKSNYNGKAPTTEAKLRKMYNTNSNTKPKLTPNINNVNDTTNNKNNNKNNSVQHSKPNNGTNAKNSSPSNNSTSEDFYFESIITTNYYNSNGKGKDNDGNADVNSNKVHRIDYMNSTPGESMINVDINGEMNISCSLRKVLEIASHDWPSVVRCFGCFLGFNYAAAKLPWVNSVQLSVTLALFAVIHWYWFDRTGHGFVFALFAAVVATWVAQILVSSGAYSFTKADFLGVRSWFPAIMYSAAVSFGAMGRQLSAEFH